MRDWQQAADWLQARAHLVRGFHAREAADYAWQEGDVAWDERNTLVYPAICSLAGLVAGAFGVGGGVVKVCAHPYSVAPSRLAVYSLTWQCACGGCARSVRVFALRPNVARSRV